MSLIRQVWALVMGTILLACAGSVMVSVWTARDSLQTQLAVKNHDNAQSLALSLSQQGGQASLIELAIAAQFDTGHYRSIVLRSPQGDVRVSRRAEEIRLPVPQWFVRLVPIESRPGLAQVSSGWHQLGTLEVVSQTVYAYTDLWSVALSITLWTFGIGVAAALIGHLGVRRLRRPLEAVVEQAEALTQRRFMTVSEPATPELRRVARAMNLMVERLRQIFAEQAEQVEQLRVQASCDPLTGLPHRRHFLACFGAQVASDDRSEQGDDLQFVLVRVRRLAELNRALGHLRTDALLREVAKVLGEPGVQGVAPVCLGRLNGSDFGLVYPRDPSRGGDAGQDLVERLRRLMSPVPGASVLVASVGCRRGATVGELMTLADSGLADAEVRGEFGYAINGIDPAAVHGGEDAWRRAIQEALVQARVELRAYPLTHRQGTLLHLECPLRIRLEEDGPFEPAARWMPYVLRTDLTCDVDLAAVALALTAIASDGRPRGVNLSPQSLAHPQFLPRLRARVEASGVAARKLWVEVDEVALERHPEALTELCRQLRPHGVHLGLEHAGDRLSSIGVLLEPGLDYVKLASGWVSGVREDGTRRAWLRSSVSMLHGLGLQVFAEGVRDAGDLDELWACGVDGATGPAVR
ncbi:MAG: hypothetical protein RL456_1312 [Pseudomonadota bacterium]